MRSNVIVSTAELVEELWGHRPPRSALATLQTYIVQLRKMLATLLGSESPNDVKKILSTEFGGYVLRISPEHFDLELFKTRAQRGSAELMAGNNHVAATELREALSLWRGPVLADVQHGQLLDAHVTRIEQYRLEILEQRIEVDLRLGRHQALLSELNELTTEHPLDENLHAKYILALYRSGQRWKALSVFQELRQTLIDELGLGLNSSLTRLHHAILNSDPALDPPADTHQLSVVDQLIGSLGQGSAR
jgi:DNA-binding SARP family transcriptional activator